VKKIKNKIVSLWDYQCEQNLKATAFASCIKIVDNNHHQGISGY
jgi:hypothetical protein